MGTGNIHIDPRPGPDPMIGRRIGGYLVVALLGEGGMGKVYLLAHADSPGLRRVLKVVHDGIAKLHPEMVERFLREARAAASLRHPNIIEICDYARFPEDGQPYLVMPFLDGVDLGAHVDRVGAQGGHRGRMSFERALPLLLQVCAALRAAHARGIIHRDLKPSNCYVLTGDQGHDGRPSSPRLVLLDFGIAKVLDPAVRQGAATRSRAVLGTPGYMAPEQARGHEVDHRADLYAFGVMAYQMLTGRRPFEGVTSEDLAIQQVSSMPPAPAALVPELPGVVSELIMRCLAPVPGQRPGTVMEVVQCLIRATRSGREVAREAAPDLLAPSSIAGPTEPTSMAGAVGRAVTVTARTGPRPGLAWAGLVLVAVAAGATLLGSRLGSGESASDLMAAQAPSEAPPVPDAGAAADAAVAIDVDAGVPREATRVAMPARAAKLPAPAPRARMTGIGTLSIKIRPWGLVWIDGRSLGQTPIHEPIRAGWHRIKLQRPDGTLESVPIRVEPDQEITLTRDWSQ